MDVVDDVHVVDEVGVVDVRAVHRRGHRAEAPRVPAGTVEIEAPPEIPRVVSGSPLLKMLPLVMVVAMVGMVALMISSGAAANPMTLLFPAMMVVSMLGMFAGGGRGGGPKTAELDESRKDYLGYLGSLRDRVRATARAQRESLVWSHPSPKALWTCAGTARMWERRAADDDFLHVRVGVGDQRLATRLVSPETGPAEDLEPVCAAQLRFFVRTHSIVRDLPTAVSLRAFSVIRFEGDGSHVHGVVRSMLLQACMFHGPDDVAVVVVAGPQSAADWDWVKWLPHHRDTEGSDSAGARRMTFRTVAEASTVLSASPRESAGPIGSGRSRRHVLIVSGGGVPDAANLDACAADESVTVFDLSAEVPAPSEDRTLVLVLDGGGIGARGRVGVEMFGTADSMDVVTATAAAKSLSPYRTPGGAGATEVLSTRFDSWDRLPGMADPATLDPSNSWVARSGRARLRVPFGTDTDGRVVELDLKEAAEGGMGPHGLCIGATGSGKSELLRTIVLGLVATHPPDVLNLVLVDFKGGATFLGLESAPHVAAVITNLAEESGMVERMRDALAGEMNRRQELLRAAGNFANVTEYSRARDGGAQLPPLPALFVVVDEFSELLTRFPEFADLFLAIGRLGRSLHIHLLLASQRLDEGRLRGLDSHLSYRIGLKTFSATESRSVLGVADAHHLTGGPGAGYLKTDSSDLVRFDASYVSGPYAPGAVSSSSVLPGAAPSAGVCLFTTLPMSPTDRVLEHLSAPLIESLGTGADTASPMSERVADTMLSAVIERLRGHGLPAHRVWLPPLDRPVPLDEVTALSKAVEGGQVDPTRLSAAVAVVDRPYDQRRDALELDLAGGSGHVAVVGGPQAGKSTALCTLVISLAARYSPRDVQFHCLDFGGGAVGRLGSLPHVGSVATRTDGDKVRRIVAEIAGTVRRREELFRARGVRSMADVRSARVSASGHDDLRIPDLMLVIDGWHTVRAEFDVLEPALQEVVSGGLSYGVHIMIAAGRWAEIRPAVKDAITSRIELRMGDPSDSDIGRARAALVPEGRPGRGITKDGLHLLIALPRMGLFALGRGGCRSTPLPCR
ncbi:MAG: type VII secretion protein EccCa [Rhodococcus sp. (in: high G+C Gram-positive bacteria)]